MLQQTNRGPWTTVDKWTPLSTLLKKFETTRHVLFHAILSFRLTNYRFTSSPCAKVGGMSTVSTVVHGCGKSKPFGHQHLYGSPDLSVTFDGPRP